jgi:hypothetical protein
VSSLWDGISSWYTERVAGDEASTTIEGTVSAAGRWSAVEGATRRWMTMDDAVVRPEHAEAHEQTVGIDEMFVVGGESLWFPQDPDNGSVWNTINCHPAETLVVAGTVESVFRRHYSGPMVTARTRSGRLVSGTPNHPVLTRDGWKALGSVRVGEDLVCDGRSVERHPCGNPDEDRMEACLGDRFEALASSRAGSGRGAGFAGAMPCILTLRRHKGNHQRRIPSI